MSISLLTSLKDLLCAIVPAIYLWFFINMIMKDNVTWQTIIDYPKILKNSFLHLKQSDLQMVRWELRLFLLVSILAIISSVIDRKLFTSYSISRGLTSRYEVSSLSWTILRAVLIAPLWEEFYFRFLPLIIFPDKQKSSHINWSFWVMSVFLFVIVHIQHSLFLTFFVFPIWSWLLARIYKKTNNIFLATLLHALYNGSCFVFVFIWIILLRFFT